MTCSAWVAWESYIAQTTCSAILARLQALHDAGFVHGDVKASNVKVAERDGLDSVKLIDLGLARALDDPEHDAECVTSGTPEYMAPEVIRGEGALPAADIYATGVILYELLTGTTPFEGGTSYDIMIRHLDDEVVPPSIRCPNRSIPPAFERAVMIALEKDPTARRTTAAAFATAIVAATPMIEPPVSCGGESLVFSSTMPTADWHLPATSLPMSSRARYSASLAEEYLLT